MILLTATGTPVAAGVRMMSGETLGYFDKISVAAVNDLGVL